MPRRGLHEHVRGLAHEEPDPGHDENGDSQGDDGIRPHPTEANLQKRRDDHPDGGQQIGGGRGHLRPLIGILAEFQILLLDKFG